MHLNFRKMPNAKFPIQIDKLNFYFHLNEKQNKNEIKYCNESLIIIEHIFFDSNFVCFQ